MYIFNRKIKTNETIFTIINPLLPTRYRMCGVVFGPFDPSRFVTSINISVSMLSPEANRFPVVFTFEYARLACPFCSDMMIYVTWHRRTQYRDNITQYIPTRIWLYDNLYSSFESRTYFFSLSISRSIVQYVQTVMRSYLPNPPIPLWVRCWYYFTLHKGYSCGYACILHMFNTYIYTDYKPNSNVII